MELTINQIKEKQKELQIKLEETLNKFSKETGIRVRGQIRHNVLSSNDTYHVELIYSSPF